MSLEALRKFTGKLPVGTVLSRSTSTDDDIYPIDDDDLVSLLPVDQQVFGEECVIALEAKDKLGRYHNIYVPVPPEMYPVCIRAIEFIEIASPFATKKYKSNREKSATAGPLETSLEIMQNGLSPRSASHLLVRLLRETIQKVLTPDLDVY